jgi:titin
MVFSSVTMTSMALTWTAPSGAAPTGYIVYRDDGDASAMPTPSIVAYDGTDSAALTAAVTGLIGGTTYTFHITALSEAGVSDVGDESTQSTSPATPLGLSSVTQTSTSISLSWSASVVSTGGSAVTSYKVYSNDGTSADAALSATAVHTTTDGTTTTATIDNLSPGLLYGFAVSAVSAAGEGEQSTVLAQSSSPGAPETGPTSSLQTSTSISLSWTAPLSDGSSGADSTGYRLYDVGGVVLYSGSATAFEQTGLTAGTSYSYEVSAVSAAGESPTTSPLAQYTAPAAPTTLTSSAWTTTSFQIDWVAPTVDASAPAVSGYTLYERVTYEMNDVSTSGAVPDDVLQTMLSESTDTVVVDTVAYDGRTNTAVSTTLSGLTGGVSYNYVVAARSDSGEGDRSAVMSASTSPPAPGTLASVSQTTTSITLSWSAPVVTTGVAATGYNLYIDDGSTGTPSTLVTCSGAAALDTTCTASGLTGGLTYSFKVSALSTAGESDASSVFAQSTSPAAVAGSMVF